MSLVTKIEFIDDRDQPTRLQGDDLNMHDYLTDRADWNGDFWEFEAKFVCEYSKRLERLYNDSPNGFLFQALWVGDTPKKTIELRIDEFVDVVRRNKISTSAKYVLRKHVQHKT